MTADAKPTLGAMYRLNRWLLPFLPPGAWLIGMLTATRHGLDQLWGLALTGASILIALASSVAWLSRRRAGHDGAGRQVFATACWVVGGVAAWLAAVALADDVVHGEYSAMEGELWTRNLVQVIAAALFSVLAAVQTLIVPTPTGIPPRQLDR